MTEPSLKDKTAKGLMWGAASNLLQQGLNLIFGIFLARLLTPGDYGMVGMLTVFGLIANNIQECGFTQALTNKREAGHSDYNAVFWFSSLVGCLLYAILFFCAPAIAHFYHTPELVPLARYLFLGFLFGSFGTAHYAYIFKHLMVKQRAISNILALVLSGTSGIVLALLGFAYWGIATQTLVYTITNTLCYWHFSGWRPTLSINLTPLKGMYGFSCKIMLNSILYHINNNVLSIVLGRFYGKNDVGYFSQANKWNIMGYSVVSGMVGGVAQPMLAAIDPADRERRKRAFRKMLRFTSFVTFPALFGLALIAPEFIEITVTDRWLPAARMMQLVCVAGAFFPISNLFTSLMVSQGRSGAVLWSNLTMSVVYVIAVIALHGFGISALLYAYVSVQIAWVAVWMAMGKHEIGLGFGAAISDIAPFALIATAAMLAGHAASLAMGNIYLSLATKIIVAAAVYLAIAYFGGSATMREAINYLIKKA